MTSIASTALPLGDQRRLDRDFIARYDTRAPRYTSYPPAPFWKPEFDGEAWRRHLAASAPEPGAPPKPLSLYVHIPFCERHCLFCACNVVITSKEGIASRYLDALEREIDLAASLASEGREVVQLHLGGGTPNYLTADEMARLMATLRSRFRFAKEAEVSIEADPRVSSREEIRRFAEVDGFTRISFGAQDFHDATQEAIGRTQTFEITRDLIAEARAAGLRSVNIDLIYGLPRQTAASWRQTIDRFLAMRPDRLALYNFAFLPDRLAHQRGLVAEEMPSPDEKLEMFLETNERLLAEGYRFIGMDHYALAEDSLALALEDGTLRRNFMGYSTLRGTDTLAFGASAISEVAGAFAQNTKNLAEHEREVAEGRLPVERGMRLNDDDARRQWVIEQAMCAGFVGASAYAGRFPGGDFTAEFHAELERLAPLQADGLVEIDSTGLRVAPLGRFFLRNVAMAFDAYLPSVARLRAEAPSSRKAPAFSRTV